jgi:hypothetical protein
MPKPGKAPRSTNGWTPEKRALASQRAKAQYNQRKAGAQLKPGYSGNPLGDVSRGRRELNRMTIDGMADAFRRGGQQAIDKVMKQSPAIFLKMLVLLVPRELEVMRTQGVKAMTDQQIEDAIAAIQALMDKRMIDVTPEKVEEDASAT